MFIRPFLGPGGGGSAVPPSRVLLPFREASAPLHDDEPPARVRTQNLLAVGNHEQRGVARRVAWLLSVKIAPLAAN